MRGFDIAVSLTKLSCLSEFSLLEEYAMGIAFYNAIDKGYQAMYER